MIVYNSDKVFVKDNFVKSKKAVGIAVEVIVKEVGGIPIMSNVAFVSGFAKFIGIEWEILAKVLKGI